MSAVSTSPVRGRLVGRLGRRLTSVVAAAAVMLGVTMMAVPAHAEGEVGLMITVDGLVATFNVGTCSTRAISAQYAISDVDGKAVVPTAAIPGWTARQASVTFTWTADAPGTYRIQVQCDDLGIVRQTTMTFTLATAAKNNSKITISVSPSTWRKGDQVTLTLRGLAPGTLAKFYFAEPEELDAIEVWNAVAGTSGVASVTVPWPETGFFYPNPVDPGPYRVGAIIESTGERLAEQNINLSSDRTWTAPQAAKQGTDARGAGYQGAGGLPDSGE